MLSIELEFNIYLKRVFRPFCWRYIGIERWFNFPSSPISVGACSFHRWQIDAKPKVSFQKLASKLREFLLSGSLKGMNIEQKGHKENRALAQTQTRPTPLKNLRVVAQPMRSAAYLIKSLSLWIVSFVFFGYYLHIVDFASALTSNFWTQWRNGEEDPTSGSKRLESPKVSSIIKEIFGSKGFPKMFSLVWRRNTSLLLWATTWYGKARWRLWHLRTWFCYLFFSIDILLLLLLLTLAHGVLPLSLNCSLTPYPSTSQIHVS